MVDGNHRYDAEMVDLDPCLATCLRGSDSEGIEIKWSEQRGTPDSTQVHGSVAQTGIKPSLLT